MAISVSAVVWLSHDVISENLNYPLVNEWEWKGKQSSRMLIETVLALWALRKCVRDSPAVAHTWKTAWLEYRSPVVTARNDSVSKKINICVSSWFPEISITPQSHPSGILSGDPIIIMVPKWQHDPKPSLHPRQQKGEQTIPIKERHYVYVPPSCITRPHLGWNLLLLQRILGGLFIWTREKTGMAWLPFFAALTFCCKFCWAHYQRGQVWASQRLHHQFRRGQRSQSWQEVRLTHSKVFPCA
jgi:hypothetical protein